MSKPSTRSGGVDDGRDRRAGDAGAAAQIDDRAAARSDAELLDDVLDEQEVERTVIEGECGALAGAVERLVIGERRLAPLDIGRRQRPQRARHFAETQIGEMPLFEVVDETSGSSKVGVDDGIRTRDSRSHSPELYP